MEDKIMRVEYKSVNKVFRPRVIMENSPQAEVLNCFLEDAENSPTIYLDLIRRAENGEEILGSSSNQVGVDFYPDRISIEHLWSDDENGEPLYTEISLSEAKKLLQNLQSAKTSLK